MAEESAPRTLRSKIRRVLASTLAVAALVMTAVSGVGTSAASPAHAAGTVGAGGYWSTGGGWLGNYIASNGTRVYCVDVLVDSIGSGADEGVISSTLTAVNGTRQVSGAELQMMNYAITNHGQTDDPIVAAAVSAYVYNFTSANWYGDGAHYISGPYASAILAAYNSIAADTAANYAAGGGSGTGEMHFAVDASNNYVGNLVVTNLSPANASGTISLTNGVFADTGLPTRDGVTNNSSLPIRGVPPEDAVEYKISAIGAFNAPGGVAADVRIHSDAPQRTAGPGSTSVSSFTISSEDPGFRSTVFQPNVGTMVSSKFVSPGETFADTLTFGLDADASGRTNEWFVSPVTGNYLPITARGTIYGPFLAQPEESALPPANATVAATDIMMTTSLADGPNIDYTVDSGFSPDEAGFYTWVWEIRQSDQTPGAQVRLPDGYHFQDRFGQVAESSISPTNLAITTEVTESELGIGQESTDTVTVSSFGGGWLQADGGRVPAVLTGTAYFSATKPELSEVAPDGAEVVGTVSMTVNKEGTTVSDPIQLPFREGYVTYQWCLIEANQPAEYRGMIAETCDMYGQSSETVTVTAPEVTTQAKELATIYDPIFDTAIVNGPVPENSFVEFSLYKRPEAGDFKRENGEVTDQQWTEEEIAALGEDAYCAADNLVTTTEAVPIAAGQNDWATYDSPEVFVDELGTYWWVESTYHEDPDSGEKTVIASGECGLPNETTEVGEPSVTTQAVAEVVKGEPASDLAMVTGPIPGEASGLVTELTFEAFKRTGDEAVCTDDTLVASLDDPIIVTEAGDYRSADVVFEEVGDYYWVETLAYVNQDGEREIVHVGECGLPNETTKVVAPAAAIAAIAESGFSLLAPIAGIGAGLLVAAGVTVLLLRRRTSRPETVSTLGSGDSSSM